jgi:hypothetical protein
MKKILAYLIVLLALPCILAVSICLSIYHTVILVIKETPEKLFDMIMNINRE